MPLEFILVVVFAILGDELAKSVCVLLFTSKCSAALGSPIKNVKFLSCSILDTQLTTIVEVLNGCSVPLYYNPMCLSVVVVPTSECAASVSNKM